MARQPRQTRIGFTGKFTPTGVDQTAGAKMRALAGLGQTIGDTAMAIGRPMIEAEAAEAGAQAAEDAARDPVTGEVLEVPTMNAAKFGSSQFESAAQQKVNQIDAAAISSYKAGLMEDINVGLFDIATQNPSNIIEYSKLSEGLYDGLKCSVPLEMQDTIPEQLSKNYDFSEWMLFFSVFAWIVMIFFSLI